MLSDIVSHFRQRATTPNAKSGNGYRLSKSVNLNTSVAELNLFERRTLKTRSLLHKNTMADEKYFGYDGENFTLPLRGSEVIGCQWLPESGPVRFVLIFVHGLGAFLTINRPYFKPINAAGGVVIGSDHFGHGRSPGERGLSSSELLLEEIGLIVHRANILFPEVPLFMYGHSMGGVLALAFVMSSPLAEKFDGLIIECPWLFDNAANSASVIFNILGRFGRWILPNTPVDTGGGWGDTHYHKEFKDHYEKSVLPHDYITPKLYASVFELRRIIYQAERWPAHLPLLFMQGAKDKSVGVDRNMEWAEELRNRFPDKVKLVLHKDGEHAMLRNDCGTCVVREILDFVKFCLAQVRV
jgi:alpha-beta hydrolase superfamily lysophospholipase